MDGEIILDRGNTNVMKLDDREQALMDEIEISVPKHQPVKRPLPTQFTPPPTQQFQEDIDSFANPNKQNPPSRPPIEDPVDYGENDNDEGYAEEPQYEYTAEEGGMIIKYLEEAMRDLKHAFKGSQKKEGKYFE